MISDFLFLFFMTWRASELHSAIRWTRRGSGS